MRRTVELPHFVCLKFQSTHPRGVRPDNRFTINSRHSFQSTHPRGVRHGDTIACTRCFLFQSTHPRGVRLNGSSLSSKDLCVSIHAPTRGATLRRCSKGMKSKFQSTHQRGVRPTISTKVSCASLFQSTHPRGVRPIGLNQRQQLIVSIHAPTRGATN